MCVVCCGVCGVQEQQAALEGHYQERIAKLEGRRTSIKAQRKQVCVLCLLVWGCGVRSVRVWMHVCQNVVC